MAFSTNNSLQFSMAEALDSASHSKFETSAKGVTQIKDSDGIISGNEVGESPGPGPGIKCVNLRAVIDTSPPFGSVKEAVTHFGGSGSWVPPCKLSGIEELEKDVIVKELQALDVLEELGTTKRMVDELKRKLRSESDKRIIASSIPVSASSPDVILMELNQAKLNLNKIMNDLAVIQSSIESLTRKLGKPKRLLGKAGQESKTHSADEVENKCVLVSSANYVPRDLHNTRHLKNMNRGIEFEASISEAGIDQQANTSLKTAELRWVAAKRMEEAAKAAEAVALAEIEDLSICERQSSAGFSIPQPEEINLNSKADGFSKKNLQDALIQSNEATSYARSIVKNLKEATEQANLSKQALEEALRRVEHANRKQHVTENALKEWMPAQDDNQHGAKTRYCSSPLRNFGRLVHQGSPLNSVNRSLDLASKNTKPVLRSSTSMRDVLSRKQVLPQMNASSREDGQNERQKHALSQMLQALKEDVTYPPHTTKKDGRDKKHNYSTERKKLGFIHISLPFPVMRPTKKRNAKNTID